MFVACWMVIIVSAVVFAYSFFVYPLLLGLLASLASRPWRRSEIEPTVTLITPAFNEEKRIASKLENMLAIDYPPEKTQILVCSDCSSDRTDEIVKSYAPRVTLVRAEERGGKQRGLNRGVSLATGEILIFSDATSYLAPSAIRKLTRHFADESIGAVSCVIRITNDPVTEAATQGSRERASGAAEGAYLGLDLKIRQMQAATGSIVGLVGACYAIRRSCYEPFDPADCDDMASVYHTLAAGKRAVMDPEVISYMLPATDARGEYRRKVRTMAGGIDTWFRYRTRIPFWRYPLYAWNFFSHKLCRWLTPIGFVLSCLSAIVLLGMTWGMAGVGIGLFFVLLGYGSTLLQAAPLRGRLKILRIPGFVLVSLLAGVTAWRQVFAGRRQVTWNPTTR